MVECEFIRKRMTAQIFLCFNRYMVECECRKVYKIKTGNRVLIDKWCYENESAKKVVNNAIQF